jgi:TetR/AcrR family transcriptional regulator, ethionamide resistance regulator
MRRTGLSRPSFYVYFRDRHDLVLKVVQHLGAELFAPSNWWYEGEGDGRELAEKALGGVVEVYSQHGPVLRALADAAADDPDVEEAYTSLVRSFIDATAVHIEEEIGAGHIATLDARETATALTWMTERYLYLSLGAEPRTPEAIVTQTLRAIWIRTLYGS